MTRSYPSDISRKQFSKIHLILESTRKKTRPRIVDLYDIFCGILYILKSGCQWRMLPIEYPKWELCYYYFHLWNKKDDKSSKSILEIVLKKLVGEVRKSSGRKEKTSFVIIDAQSVKNTDTAEKKGYDAGKKISGIKRHIAVDTQGLPHAIHITTANITDRNGCIEAFSLHKNNLFCVKNVLADGGYSGEKFAKSVQEILGCILEIAKRNTLHTFTVIPKRWVVEHSFAWIEKCRRLWKNCERKLHTSLNMLVLAFIALLLKRF
ncbi:IS5 family transposase [Candidatus Rhabdochlamydia oedothoracis]|uniref:IS5 family transposase n=1 Tax=Candidatus Rhabdochlamydia oedothoracis TaxID=2720720 RepID=UPI003D9C7B07